jgi:CRP-like cAMP-binding protein
MITPAPTPQPAVARPFPSELEQSWNRIRPCLELVPLKPRCILHHARLPIEQVYFVESGLVSVIVATDEDNHVVEGWIIGCEGLAGIPVALGVAISPHRRIVQMEGRAWTIKSVDLAQAM